MGKFHVKTTVEFFQEVEAEDEAAAEAMGWEWEDGIYGGVYSIEVDEMEDEDE